MIYMLHFKKEAALGERIGLQEVQHYSSMKHFLPLLEKRGIVIFIEELEDQVNGVQKLANYLGESCLFISFSPPDEFYHSIQCPKLLMTSMIQHQGNYWWNQEEKLTTDLLIERIKLSQAAIVDCEAAHQCLTTITAAQIPIARIAPPLWDAFQNINKQAIIKPHISTNGDVIDTKLPSNQPKSITYPIPLTRKIEAIRTTLHTSERILGKASRKLVMLEYLMMRGNVHYHPHQIRLDGVVYTTVVAPNHPFKNWRKLINDFCVAFKHKSDAVLIVKVVGWSRKRFKKAGFCQLRWKYVKCRIIIIYEHLSMAQYENLVGATDYILNISTANEMGNSLLEFMSAGTPAISQKHPKMTPLNKENTFIFGRTKRESFSFKEQLLESYKVKINHPLIYESMAKHAKNTMEKFCARAIVQSRLDVFLDKIEKEFF